MNSERLLEAFSKIGDDPYRIQQLRKIAIALAVSGKLDKGAATLSPRQVLDAVGRVKADLAKRGIIPKPKEHAEVTLEQLPEAFSDTTRFARLGELARIEKGQTGIQQAQPGAFPLVVTAAERATCDHFDFDGSAAIIPLVSSTGHGNASINRLHYQEGKFALGTILVAVFPHDPNLISARFLFEYLSAFKEELLVARMTGTANVTLSVGRVADVPIPLICPEVQRKVDELMALCDQLEQARAGREAVRDRLTTASLARLTAPDADAEAFQSHARFALQSLPTLTTRPDQIKALRQTILNLAVRGKLVAQDAADEPAAELLTRIRPKIKLQSDRSRPDEKDTLPQGWAWARIDELTDVGTGVTPSKSEPAYHSNGTVPWVNSAATNLPIIDSVEKFVTERAVKECRLKIYPQGSLVVALYGQGKTRGQVAELRIAATVNQACAVIVFPEGFESLRSYMQLSLTKQYAEMRSLAEGGAQPNLNLGKIKSLELPLPPLAEQHRIATKVDALMALCDQLEASLTTTATTCSKLLNALLHEALEPAADELEAAE